MDRVDAAETSKLGWSRDTYTNTYAPQFPMQAILANHGFKAYEQYDPTWLHVPVPVDFLLSRVCPVKGVDPIPCEGDTGVNHKR